ncbi:hypothetical protein MYX64_04345 [Nitrospinae bacterium AH_259_B05_G02_I21]|nr:hypothetical protein [Nitrospinae bacterium AH_259_B05_G02_I21]MDA2932473.1 hypothetical protein [Nitrospinae bacterium AH-259-F20]
MFKTLTTQAIKLFGKEFLISAFFPVLIFFCSLLFLFKGWAGVIDQVGSWLLFGGKLTKESVTKFVFPIIYLFIIYLFSYVIYGAIPKILDLYQGNILFIKNWLRRRQVKKFEKKKKKWNSLNLRKDALIWCNQGYQEAHTDEDISVEELVNNIRKLDSYFSRLEYDITENVNVISKRRLVNNLTKLYIVASKKDNLQQVQRTSFENLIQKAITISGNITIKKLIDSCYIEAYSKWLDSFNEKYQYPDEKYLQATKLGTVLMTVNTYPKLRYGIDIESIWPRLLHVIPENYFKRLSDSKIYLNFTVIISFFSFIIALISIPYSYLFWNSNEIHNFRRGIVVLIIAFSFARIFYLLSIEAARVFGEMMKSSVDLFRRKLLNELNIDLSNVLTPKDEKEQIWEKLSAFIILGSVTEEPRYKKQS